MVVRQPTLSDEKIRQVTGGLLSDRFERFGYKKLVIDEEEDFDGAAILRLVAEVESKIPARELIDALLIVQSALEKEGEERTVFLSAHVPGVEEPQEEDEE